MLKRYYENGYTDVGAVMALGQTYNFLISGRGTGKTYSALKACRDLDRTFMFVRRTATQLENIASNNTNPIKANALKDKFEYNISKVAKGIYKIEEVEINRDDNGHEEIIPIRLLGYMCSLSGMANLRGMSFDDVDTIIFDEFIPETHERPIKHEFDAFANLYETINRNREFDDPPKTPVQVLCLANANNLANPILLGFELVDKVENMIKKKQYYSILSDRSIAIILYSDSTISDKKRQTALYRALNPTSQFSEMALANEFSYSDTSGVISRSLDGMVPLLKIDDITIYQHKDTRLLYASRHSSGSVPSFSTKSEEDLKRLTMQKTFIAFSMLSKRIEYETFEIKAKLLAIFL